MVEGIYLLILQIAIFCLVTAGTIIQQTLKNIERYKKLTFMWSLHFIIISLATIASIGYLMSEDWLNFGINIAIIVSASVSLSISLATNFRGYLSAALLVSNLEKEETNTQ